MDYYELKELKAEKINNWFSKCGGFFEFRNIVTNPNYKIGVKYKQMFNGCFIPIENFELYNEYVDNIEEWFSEMIKLHHLKEQAIKYELYNHECFLSGDIYPVVLLFYGHFSEQEIWEVYLKTLPEFYEVNS